MKKIIFLLILNFCSSFSQVLTDIECPFPGGSLTDHVKYCGVYSACTLTGTMCHMADNSIVGYTVSAPTATSRGNTYTLDKISLAHTLFENDIQTLTFEIIHHEDYHLQIKIFDPNSDRYEIPYPVNTPSTQGASPLYTVTVSDPGTPFSFAVTRNSNGNKIFQMEGPLSFEDQFIQLTTTLASGDLYGFGENSHLTFKKNFSSSPRDTYPIFTRDQPPGNHFYNEYGGQPYYVLVEDAPGNTHSVLFYNSNSMEYSTFQIDGTPALTLRTIGGIVDLHFFLGPTPEEVNKQYANAIGLPTFPPYAALGFHLSRYGYTDINHVRDVRDRMKAKGIPQDVQTFDIDYMLNERDFTYDPVLWAGLPEFVEELHADNVLTTIILDPAVVIDIDNYEPYERGVQSDAFIKWSSPNLIPNDQHSYSEDYVIGYVWPDNKTAFPDFFYQPAIDWWINECVLFKQVVNYDYIWIDMNEPANFGTNLNRPFNYPEELPDWSLKCPYTKLDEPPFITKATYHDANDCKRISDKTLCMSALQRDTTNNYTHYDVHNLYGLSELYATEQAMETIYPGEKHLIYTRSTFPGAGKYATHWLGDNSADWDQLRWSMIGMLEFNLFAIPNVGADVCGFFGEPTEELCIRWMQLGAFYPFNRNHNTIGMSDQDPAVDKWPTLNTVSRDVLLLRYKYNPFLYTLFYQSHTFGNSIVRPFFNIFPADSLSRGIDDQFFWGTQMMMAPVVTEGATSRTVYFPEGLYYDIESGFLTSEGSATESVDAPLEKIPVFIRGGTIIPYQEPDVTTYLSRLNAFGFTVALDETGSANGYLYYDDGKTANPPLAEQFHADLSFSSNVFSMTVLEGSSASAISGLAVETVVICGYPSDPTGILINGVSTDSWTFANGVLTISLNEAMGADLAVEIL